MAIFDCLSLFCKKHYQNIYTSCKLQKKNDRSLRIHLEEKLGTVKQMFRFCKQQQQQQHQQRITTTPS
jgi:hypothetical protein